MSAWRRKTVGDLTGAFNFAHVDKSVPRLPHPSDTSKRVTMSTCATSAPLDLATGTTNSLKKLERTTVAAYPVTVNKARPPQEKGRARSPSGPVACKQ